MEVIDNVNTNVTIVNQLKRGFQLKLQGQMYKLHPINIKQLLSVFCVIHVYNQICILHTVNVHLHLIYSINR